jgi:hypothetical protein
MNMKEMSPDNTNKMLMGLVQQVEKHNRKCMLAIVDGAQKEFAKCKTNDERDKATVNFMQAIQGIGIAGGHQVKITYNADGSALFTLV